MNRNKAAASGRECRGKRIEWTGAGGDYFLAVVVDQDDEVIAERWEPARKLLAEWRRTGRIFLLNSCRWCTVRPGGT